MVRRPSVHDLITSKKAPNMGYAQGHGVKVEYPGATLYLSAIFPLELKGRPCDGDLSKQSALVFSHATVIAKDAGFSMEELVKCTVYLKDLKGWDVAKVAYQNHMVGQNQPAITVVQVAALPHEFEIGLDAIFVKRGMSPQDILAEET